jgi:hypothetical protein
MAVNRVEKLLRRVTAALETAGVPYAVIGGNAVAAWVASTDEGAVRATKDVDLLVHRSDLDAMATAFDPCDLVPAEVFGVRMFVDRANPNPKLGVHLIFANERVRSTDPHPAPDPSESVRSHAGFRVVEIGPLLRMKLTAFRLLDQVHIQDMFAVGLIDAALARSLPPDLLARLREVRDTMEWHTPPPAF